MIAPAKPQAGKARARRAGRPRRLSSLPSASRPPSQSPQPLPASLPDTSQSYFQRLLDAGVLSSPTEALGHAQRRYSVLIDLAELQYRAGLGSEGVTKYSLEAKNYAGLTAREARLVAASRASLIWKARLSPLSVDQKALLLSTLNGSAMPSPNQAQMLRFALDCVSNKNKTLTNKSHFDTKFNVARGGSDTKRYKGISPR